MSRKMSGKTRKVNKKLIGIATLIAIAGAMLVVSADPYGRYGTGYGWGYGMPMGMMGMPVGGMMGYGWGYGGGYGMPMMGYGAPPYPGFPGFQPADGNETTPQYPQYPEYPQYPYGYGYHCPMMGW